MMKKRLLKEIVLLLTILLLTGCSEQQAKSQKTAPLLDTSTFTLNEHPIPVSIQGTEILVGETTLQTLLDAKLPIVVSEWTGSDVLEREADPNEILSANSNFTDLSCWITDATFARISIEAGAKDTRMGDAVITRLELHLSHHADTLPDSITIDGVPLPEITRSKTGRMFPYFEQSNLSISLQGANYDCNLLFSPKTYVLYQFSLEKVSINELLSSSY